jgi:threonine/homoserine efflux transporter RhtA
MLDWVLLVIAGSLGVAGLAFRQTRVIIAVVLAVAGVALNTTTFMGFVGVPMLLAAGILLYTEYLQRSHLAAASSGTAPAPPATASPAVAADMRRPIGSADDPTAADD